MSTIIQAKSFGIVVQMSENSYSDDPDTNSVIHFPISKEIVIINIMKCLYYSGISDYIVYEIVIGHEHGEDKKKCHMQMYIEFNVKVRKTINPGSFEINGKSYLYIFQRARAPKKLKEYCKKNGDFLEILPNKKVKDLLKEKGILDELVDVDDPFDVVLNKDNLSCEQIKTIFQKCSVTDYKKTYLLYARKIYETYENFIKKSDEQPLFEWKFPQHMIEYCQNIRNINCREYATFKKIINWYDEYCKIDQTSIKRRKALFLFSIQGGMGKSYFARGLVPEISICNSPFYVYCRGSLDAAEFLKKKDTARLVILDDINYIDKDIEIWKALAVSEPTNIRSPYHNIPWFKSLPCIMLSNNIKTLKYWMETDDLKTRCVFIGIDFYIGPPGTEASLSHNAEFLLSDDITIRLHELNK